jgi:hypothetical protein
VSFALIQPFFVFQEGISFAELLRQVQSADHVLK